MSFFIIALVSPFNFNRFQIQFGELFDPKLRQHHFQRIQMVIIGTVAVGQLCHGVFAAFQCGEDDLLQLCGRETGIFRQCGGKNGSGIRCLRHTAGFIHGTEPCGAELFAKGFSSFGGCGYSLIRLLTVGYMQGREALSGLVDVMAAAFRLIDHTRFDHNAVIVLHELGGTEITQLAGLLAQ